MNNISNLTLLLCGLGFAFLILILIIMCVRVAKNKKAFNGATGFLLFLAIVSLLGGGGSVLYKDKIPVSVQPLKISAPKAQNGSKSGTAQTTSTANGASKTTFVQAPFDSNGSVKPKTIKDSSGAITAIIDADGTETKYDNEPLTRFPIFISPDKTAYGFYDYDGNDGSPTDADLMLFVPNGKTVSGKGNGCTQYEFGYTPDAGSSNIYQCDTYFTDDFTYHNDPLESRKQQTINGDSMKPQDFLNQMLPDIKPTKPIANNILNGKYSYTDKQIVSTSTPVTLDFEGNDVIFKCDYLKLNNPDDTYGYKLESVGKNAYKLYLYYRTVVKGDDGKYDKVMYGAAIKKTFLIYMNSKDSFDFMFFTDLSRQQVTMNKG